jgi:hypothetical protein
MRRTNLRTGTALALILPVLMAPAFMTNAAAQEKKDQRGGAPAAAVQRAAPPAPAPRMAAPVAAAPHFAAPAAPAARIAAPVQQQHFQPQQQQQHFVAPVHTAAPTRTAAPVHVATPNVATQHVVTQPINRSNFAHSDAGHGNAASAVVKQQQIQAHGSNTGLHNAGNNAGAHDLAHRGPTNPNGNNAVRNATGQAVTGKNVTGQGLTDKNANGRTVTGPAVTGPAVTGPNATGKNATGPNTTIPNSSTSKVATPNNATTANPNVLGRGPENRGRNAVTQQALTPAQQQAQAQARAQIYAGHGKPILHNQTFANASTRDPAARALARATFQGGFSQFHARDRHDRFADRRGFHGVVIGWGGPVFWPYAYADLVDYTFWPSANDTFWPYAYDDVYDGIFGAYAPDASAYANVPSAGRRPLPRGSIASGVTGVATGAAAGGMAQICSGQASGLTDFPIERIAQQVGPTNEQRSLLNQLKDATAQAVNVLKSACPTDLPSTPTGRLAAMRQRIEPMLQAVQLVRPALDAFYQSLSDEQKERFIALESEGAPKATRQQPNLAQACGGSAKQIASLPINQIQQLLHPNDVQRAALDELNTASAQAAAVLNENCTPDQSLTPPGRLAAMETRLSGMLKALDTVQPALAKFYNSLTDEQRARFDRLGPRQG